MILNQTCDLHKFKQLTHFCLDESCQKRRLICQECLNDHAQHLDSLSQFNEVQQKVQQGQLQSTQLIKQIKQSIERFQCYQNKLILALEGIYNIEVKTINEFNTQKLNDYIYQIAQLMKIEKLSQSIKSDLENQNQKTIQYINNLQLETISYFVQNQDSDKLAEKFYQQGYDYWYKQQYLDAIKLFDQVFYFNPKHQNSIYYKGLSLQCLCQYQKSQEQYEKILQIAPEQKDALLGNAETLQMLKKYDRAVEFYNKLLLMNSKDIRSLFGKGESLRSLSLNQDSINWFDQVLQIEPFQKYALVKKGQALGQMNQQNLAQECFKKVRLVDPQFYNRMFGEDGEQQLYKKFLNEKNIQQQNIDLNFKMLLAKGESLMDIGEYSKALILLNQAVKLLPSQSGNIINKICNQIQYQEICQEKLRIQQQQH